MKIVHITPGSGGTFYCQNCFRDNELLKALRTKNHDVYNVPMYLPLNVDTDIMEGDTPVFYGAINIYLKEKIPMYRHAPDWVEKIFDSQAMLKFAAKKSGSTRAAGLEEMTLSMLRGEEGRQATELDRLIKFLKKEIQPDIVHLSNALLLGLAKRIKLEVGSKLICSLQDENEWVDPMAESYRDKVWDLMAERATDVDCFIAASKFYAEKSIKQLKIPSAKIEVLYGGINLSGYEKSNLPDSPPVIGYLCRLSKYFGLDILLDAVIKLKTKTKFKNLQLHITGGYTEDDREFVASIKNTIDKNSMANDIIIFENFRKEYRYDFLKNLTLLSVPVPQGEAFGAYMIEALASGVPVVQPNIGCYPEFIDATQGGIIYEPNNAETLATAIELLLNDREKLLQLGEQGHKVVVEKFTVNYMAENTLKVYEKVFGQK